MLVKLSKVEKDIVDEFCALAYERGWTIRHAARELNTDHGYYSRVANQQKRPSIKLLQAMLQVMRKYRSTE